MSLNACACMCVHVACDFVCVSMCVCMCASSNHLHTLGRKMKQLIIIPAVIMTIADKMTSISGYACRKMSKIVNRIAAAKKTKMAADVCRDSLKTFILMLRV